MHFYASATLTCAQESMNIKILLREYFLLFLSHVVRIALPKRVWLSEQRQIDTQTWHRETCSAVTLGSCSKATSWCRNDSVCGDDYGVAAAVLLLCGCVCVCVCASPDSRLVYNVMMQFTSSALVQFYVVFKIECGANGRRPRACADWWCSCLLVQCSGERLDRPNNISTHRRNLLFPYQHEFIWNTIDFFFFHFAVICQSRWPNATKQRQRYCVSYSINLWHENEL